MNYDRLKRLLEDRRWNISILADKSGMTGPAISKILRGANLSVHSLEKIAEAFNVPIGYFFDEDKSNNTAIGERAIAGDGNTLYGDVMRETEKSPIVKEKTQQEIKSYQQIIAQQQEEITKLQDKVISLQDKVISLQDKVISVQEKLLEEPQTTK